MKKILSFLILLLGLCTSCENHRIKQFLAENSTSLYWYHIYDDYIKYIKLDRMAKTYSFEKYDLHSNIAIQIVPEIDWYKIQPDSTVMYLQRHSGKYKLASFDINNERTSVINGNIENYRFSYGIGNTLKYMIYFDGKAITLLNLYTGDISDHITPRADNFAYSRSNYYYNSNDTVYLCRPSFDSLSVNVFAINSGELIAVNNNFAAFYDGFKVYVKKIANDSIVKLEQLHYEEGWLHHVEHNEYSDIFLCYSYSSPKSGGRDDKLVVLNLNQKSPSIRTFVYFERMEGRIVSDNLDFWKDGRGYRYMMDDEGNVTGRVPTLDSYLETNDVSIVREFQRGPNRAAMVFTANGEYLLIVQNAMSDFQIYDFANGPIDLRIDYQYVSFSRLSDISYSNRTISGVVKDGETSILVEFDPLDSNMDASILARGSRIYKLEDNKYEVSYPDGYSKIVRTSGYSFIDNSISDIGTIMDFLF